MIVALETATPAFFNDILDEVRVFFGAVTVKTEAVDAPADLYIVHKAQRRGEEMAASIQVSGLFSAQTTRVYPVSRDALIDKRLHKRAIKLAVYDAMKQGTGVMPPWGSLTGVRPTRIVYADMAQGATLDEAVRHAAQVFDVSAPKLSLLKEIITQQSTLPPLLEGQVDVYVGIPFCVTRCAYCSFLSGELGDGSMVAPYVDALLKEIDVIKAWMGDIGLHAMSVYVGGGTPTALPAPALRRVLAALGGLAHGEFTVEAGRPDTLDEEKLTAILDAGATRISINPQTAHDETLRRIGRAHTTKQTLDAFEMARRLGFQHINMDVIAGLPGEDERMFAQTLDFVEALKPQSLTVHTLSIKRSSLLHLWQAALPKGDMVANMVDLGRQRAHKMDMRAYYLYRQKYMAGNLENVGYALKDHACRYNVHMMEETGSVLALGAGGISKRVYQDGGKISRAPNVAHVGAYIARVEEMVARKMALWQKEDR